MENMFLFWVPIYIGTVPQITGFSVTYSFQPYHGPEVDSAPSENGYQGHFLEVKAAGTWGWRPNRLHVPNVMKICDPKPPGNLWATPGLLGTPLPFTVPQTLTILPHYHTNAIAFRYCQISPIFSPSFLISYKLQRTPSTVRSLRDLVNLAHSGKSNLFSVWAYGLSAKLRAIFYGILYKEIKKLTFCTSRLTAINIQNFRYTE
jgi:hypothetical protein